jgi:hypothetical protein
MFNMMINYLLNKKNKINININSVYPIDESIIDNLSVDSINDNDIFNDSSILNQSFYESNNSFNESYESYFNLYFEYSNNIFYSIIYQNNNVIYKLEKNFDNNLPKDYILYEGLLLSIHEVLKLNILNIILETPHTHIINQLKNNLIIKQINDSEIKKLIINIKRIFRNMENIKYEYVYDINKYKYKKNFNISELLDNLVL